MRSHSPLDPVPLLAHTRSMTLNCTWRDIMREVIGRLGAVGIEHPARDARLLLAQALAIDPVDVIIREVDAVDPVGLIAYEKLVQRRLAHEPVSRIRGTREFFGRTFIVTPDVLDPRPETELLVEQGIVLLPPGGLVADLGTGSGCILLSVLAERGDASGVGVDISPAAIAVAIRNAAALDIARAELIVGGWSAAIRVGPFDLVLSNPPYVTEAEFRELSPDVRNHDPRIALVGGADGLDPYRAILALADRLLTPGGWIGFEFGARQGEAIQALMLAAGLTEITLHDDLAGHTRAAFGRRS